MVHTIKLYFEDQKNGKQIRRLTVSSEVVGKFDLLASKIREIFPTLANKTFDVTWRDPENDVIHMSSDVELAQFLANSEEGLLRIYLYTSDCQPTIQEKPPKVKSSQSEVHPNVVCDACDKTIYGNRYKCLQCRNYDLCSDCNIADKHGDHDMIKLVKPSHVSREWVFLGARKLWKSMFGRCPSAFYQQYQQHKESSAPQSEKSDKSDNKRPQWQAVVDDLLKGDFVPAEKLLKDNLGHFLNFVDSNFGGVDVKIENPRSAPGGPCPFRQGASHFFHETKEEKVEPEIKQDVLNKPAKENTQHTEENVKTTIEKEIQVEDNKPDVSHLEEDAKLEKDEFNNIFETLATPDNNTKADNQQVKDGPPTPCGLFCEVESSACADGWTLVHDTDASSFAASGDHGAKPKIQAIYPDINKTLKSSQVLQEKIDVKVAEENVKPKEIVNAEDPKPKETVLASQDPEIMNALMKMQAMGFTNEGGWLERLLVTKNGNINSALDALYPSARRH